MRSSYNGRCPLCSDRLYEESGTLRCHNGHYQVERSKFERIWQDFNTDVAVLRKKNRDGNLSNKELWSMEEEQVKQLLKDLQEANSLGRTV